MSADDVGSKPLPHCRDVFNGHSQLVWNLPRTASSGNTAKKREKAAQRPVPATLCSARSCGCGITCINPICRYKTNWKSDIFPCENRNECHFLIVDDTLMKFRKNWHDVCVAKYLSKIYSAVVTCDLQYISNIFNDST